MCICPIKRVEPGAHANGVRTIGILWGYGSREELEQAGSDLLCHQPVDLPRLL